METKQLRLPNWSLATFSIQLTVVFALVGLVGILNHEMWRDELQAWMLARDSASVIDLYQNMRFEGHPALWHLCLYGLTRMSQNPLVMQLFHLGIATINVYLLAQFSPFTRLQKTLLAFGYFNLYEYALISRSYALGVLLVLLFCVLYPSYQRQLAAGARSGWGLMLPFVALGLLANTSVYGLCLSAALSLALICSQVECGCLPWMVHRWLGSGVGLGLLLSSWGICYFQVGRINAGNQLTKALAEPTARSSLAPLRRLITIGAHIWRSYVPIPAVWKPAFWNTNFLADMKRLPNIADMEVTQIIAFCLSLLLIFGVVRLLWQRPKWLLVYSTGTTLMLGFSYLFRNGGIRHHGYLFILLLACLWLAQTEQGKSEPLGPFSQIARRSRPGNFWVALAAFGLPLRRQKQFFTGLLVLHMFAGTFAYSMDLAQPFSGSKATADFLRSHELNEFPIFGYDDFKVSPLSGYLNKPIYYPNKRQFGSFWTNKRKIINTELIDQIQSFVSQSEQPVVLVLTQALQAPIPNISVQLLAHLPSKLIKAETMHVYLAQPTNSKVQSP